MSGRGFWQSFLGALIDALTRASKQSGSARPPRSGQTGNATLRGRGSAQPAPRSQHAGSSAEGSPGQFGADATRDLTAAEVATLAPSYAPKPDGDPDPGEIVWTWVPYAEHDGRGKDRPVLIVARTNDGATAGCYLSTKQHRGFISVGTGAWDSQGRESFLSPERVLRVTDGGMRREGHVLDADRFARAVTQLARVQPLSGPR